MTGTTADRRLRPVDRLTVAYLGLTAAALLLLSGSNPRAVSTAAIHLAGIFILVAARRLRFHRTRVGDWILSFYPILLSAFLYTEVGFLISLWHPGVLHDPAVQKLESTLFRGQPSRDLHRELPYPILGEYLHLGYTSYYLLAPLLAAVLWFRRPRTEYDLAIATVGLSFYISFTIFVLYPVAGPYHSFPRIPVEEVGLWMPHLTRFILDRGSSIGAAFPSSHVAVSVTVWIMAVRYHHRLAIVLAFLVPALAVGSVYGGYHYAIDAAAGAVLGILAGTLGHGLVRMIAGRESYAGEEGDAPKARSRSTPASTDSSA